MIDPLQAERDAITESSQGHQESFAAQHSKVHGNVQEMQDRYAAAGQHYDRAGHTFRQAADAHLNAVPASLSDRQARAREQAGADYGFAASDFWYAGRSYADAYDFDHAAEAMEAAATCYVAGARLLEEEGQHQQASTLRVEATFRYLDAERYFRQAADFRRNLARNLHDVGERRAASGESARADELAERARAAAAAVDLEGPNLHGAYQRAYAGADKSAYK